MKPAIAICLTVAAVFVLNAAIGNCQPGTPDEIARRVECLEQKEKLLEENYANKKTALEREFALKSGELAQDAANLKKEWQNFQKQQEDRTANLAEKTEMWIARIEFIAMFLGLLSLGAILVVWCSIVKYAEKKAREVFEREYTKNLEELLKLEREKIGQIIRDRDTDQRLRETKFVLALSGEGADTTFIEKFLAENFPNYALETFDRNRAYREYDLVFFNNEDEGLFKPDQSEMKTEEINDFINNRMSEFAVFFYFGLKTVYVNDKAKRKFASATFRSQIYGNIMNALRHQDFLSRRRGTENKPRIRSQS